VNAHTRCGAPTLQSAVIAAAPRLHRAGACWESLHSGRRHARLPLRVHGALRRAGAI